MNVTFHIHSTSGVSPGRNTARALWECRGGSGAVQRAVIAP